MNILFLTSWYPNKSASNVGIFIRKHAKALSNFAGVFVVCHVFNKNQEELFNVETVTIDNLEEIIVYSKQSTIPFFCTVINLFIFLYSLFLGIRRAYILASRFDIAVVNVAYRSGIAALLLKYFSKLKYVIIEHSSLYTLNDLRFRLSYLERRILRAIFYNAEYVMPVSDFLGLNIKRHFQKVDNFVKIANVVDLNPAEANKLNLGQPDNVKFIVVSGLSSKEKNIDGLITAFKMVLLKNNNLELHIVGDGSLRYDLESLSAQYLNKNIYFHGAIGNEIIADYYYSCDSFVLASNIETFSVVAAEALCMGLPVIVTKCGGPEEFINLSNGKLVEKNNDFELSNAILEIANNLKCYDRDKISEDNLRKFSPDKIGKEIFDVLKGIVNND